MIKPEDIDAIVFDFDGVLTDDKVYVDQEGSEMVRCSRKDGLGFDLLRETSIRLFIVSTERNPVVGKRGEKLRVTVLQGVSDKIAAIQAISQDYGFALDRTLFVGNDINDLPAMRICGLSACPADAHLLVRESAGTILCSNGGDGVAREIAESLLGIDPLAKWKAQS